MHVLFCASGDLNDAKYIRKGSKNLLQMKFGTGDTIAMCGKVVECKKTKFGVMLTLNDGEIFVITAGTFNKNALQDASNILQKFSEGNKEIYLLIYANPFYKGEIYLNANQDYSVIEVTKQIYEKFHEIRKKGLIYLTEKFNGKNKKSEKEKEEMSQEKKNNEKSKEKSKEKTTEKPIPMTEKIMPKREEVVPKTDEKETMTKEEMTKETMTKEEMTKETITKEEISEVSSEISSVHLEISKEGENVFVEGVFEMSEDEYEKQRANNLAIVRFVENLAKDKKGNVIGIEEVASELSKNENFSSLKNINLTDKLYELLETGYFYEPKPGYIKVIT